LTGSLQKRWRPLPLKRPLFCGTQTVSS
jgi:hypothetical protein